LQAITIIEGTISIAAILDTKVGELYTSVLKDNGIDLEQTQTRSVFNAPELRNLLQGGP